MRGSRSLQTGLSHSSIPFGMHVDLRSAYCAHYVQFPDALGQPFPLSSIVLNRNEVRVIRQKALDLE